MGKETPKTQKQEKTTGTIEAIENRNIYLEFELPSGKKCVIKRFKGKHVKQAQRLMNPVLKGEDYSDCLAATLIEVDGNKIVVEDLSEMDGVDYMKMMNPINQLFL